MSYRYVVVDGPSAGVVLTYNDPPSTADLAALAAQGARDVPAAEYDNCVPDLINDRGTGKPAAAWLAKARGWPRVRASAAALVALILVTACAAPAPRYELVPVPATPFTLPKVEVGEAICAENGKVLRCVATGPATTDCECVAP